MKTLYLLLVAALIAGACFYGMTHHSVAVPVAIRPSQRATVAPGRADTTGTVKEGEGVSADQRELLKRWASGELRLLSHDEVQNILVAWSKQDVHAALDFVAHAPRFPFRDHSLAIPLAQICQTAPCEAQRWILNHIQDPHQRSRIADEIVSDLWAEAPLAALEFVAASDFNINTFQTGRLLGAVARTQPELALQYLSARSPEKQKQLLHGLMEGWSSEHPVEALTWYSAQPARDEHIAESLAMACAKSGKMPLSEIVARLQLPPERMGQIARRLGQAGVLLDDRMLDSLTGPQRRDAAIGAVRNIEENPDAVLALVRRTVTPEEQAVVLAGGLHVWLESDRQAAEAWLEQLADRRLVSQVREEIETDERQSDPQQALAHAESISDRNRRLDVVAQALNRIAWQAPAEAAAWLVQHPADTPAKFDAGAITYQYLERDDAAAMAWIAKLDAGPVRDSALATAARYWVTRELDFADASVSSIGDAEVREKCLFAMYGQLAGTSSASVNADAWLESKGVPAEVRKSWRMLRTTHSRVID